MKLALSILALLALTLTGCEEDPRGKISTVQQPKEDIDYQVTFLFEVDGVKVYRFYDKGRRVYFTNANGKTEYNYTTTHRNSKYGTTTTHHHVESINSCSDPDCPCREKGEENE